jgi:SAM-dependent methyltransferase
MELLRFIDEFKHACLDGVFLKLILSKPVGSGELGSRVEIKRGKRFVLETSIAEVTRMLPHHFKNAVLFTHTQDIRLSYSKKMVPKLDYSKATGVAGVSDVHDRPKKRLISIEDNTYLKALGVVSQDNQVIPRMQHKFKQITHYIDTIESVIKHSPLATASDIRVLDMGSGKGYLTFACYDFLTTVLGKRAQVSGVELRPELVSLCTQIAHTCGFTGLTFAQGHITTHPVHPIDILIALHACDTATDDAIFYGIQAKASIIITAPCCHHQIRKELTVQNALQSITKYGILKERQSEIVTDALRALILELHGYKPTIFEFIADAHTHKNVMIVGVKKPGRPPRAELLKKIASLKECFGIQSFYLEGLGQPLS